MFLTVARITNIITLILKNVLKTTKITNSIKWILENVLELLKMNKQYYLFK